MGKLKYLVCLLALLSTQLLGTCSALKCYACSSNISWKDCEKAKTETSCPSSVSSPRCYKVYKKDAIIGLSTYVTGCTSSSKCTTNAQCTTTSICEVSCCSGSLCNRGNSVNKGVLTALIAAAISLVYITLW